MNIIRFCKNWTLPIAMLSGVVLYFVYVNVPWFLTTREVVGQLVDVIQPVLIFTMLFLTFCKVDFSELRFAVGIYGCCLFREGALLCWVCCLFCSPIFRHVL